MYMEKEFQNDIYYANIYYEIHIAEDKINLFRNKYKIDFIDFEKKIYNNTEESFDEWDDYIEWKAYNNILNNLLKAKVELDSGINKAS